MTAGKGRAEGNAMRFKTVADVLDIVKDFHAALALQFSELEQLTTSERAQLMLDYLNRHQKHLAELMEQYEDDAASGLLNTWLQYAPDSHPEALVAKVRNVDLNDVNSVIVVALAADDYLISLYREVADHADSDEVKELFKNLIRLVDNERHSVSRAAFRLSDI